MCVELTMNVSILSLRLLSDPVKILSASVSMKVVWQDNPVNEIITYPIFNKLLTISIRTQKR